MPPCTIRVPLCPLPASATQTQRRCRAMDVADSTCYPTSPFRQTVILPEEAGTAAHRTCHTQVTASSLDLSEWSPHWAATTPLDSNAMLFGLQKDIQAAPQWHCQVGVPCAPPACTLTCTEALGAQAAVTNRRSFRVSPAPPMTTNVVGSRVHHPAQPEL